MKTTVRILRQPGWPEIYGKIIERFGFPGPHNYIVQGTNNSIDFIFDNSKDALVFALEHNGQFVDAQQITVEHVTRFF
jgi:hypothetical protein